MTKTEYEIQIAWAEMWSELFDIAAKHFTVDLYKWWWGWALSQTGFLYMLSYDERFG